MQQNGIMLNWLYKQLCHEQRKFHIRLPQIDKIEF